MSCLPETFNPCQSIKVATKGHEGFFLPQGESLQLERGLNSGVSNATLFYFTGWAEEKPGLLLLPFYSRIVISTASTACKPANLPFQTRKNMWQQIFCWCTFSRSWVEGLYIYIIYSRYWCWATLPPIQGIIDSTASEINDTVEEEIW